MTARAHLLTSLVAMTTAAGGWSTAFAQSVRVSGVTSFQYVEVRPLITDSVDVSLVAGDGLFRRAADGHLVRCIEGTAFCRFMRSSHPISTVPATQDVTVSVWGIGRGIRGYARARGRATVAGEDSLWPRSSDNYDLLAAYAELSRRSWRLRVGRQWKTSGLGYHNYDGGSVVVWTPTFTFEAFGGWSLAQGLNEPRTGESLAALESFAPNVRALLVGTQVSYRPRTGSTFTVLYQREIRHDRAALYTERVSVDAVTRTDRVSLEGSIEADVATTTLNEARLRAWYNPSPNLGLGIYARHYQPFFELWTIWGSFDPIGFDEIGANAMWRIPGSTTDVDVRGARRSYQDTGASSVFGPVRSSGWYLGINVSTRVGRDWQIQGGARRDIGFGAAKNDGYLSLRRQFDNGTFFGVRLQAYQRLYEFRVAEGTVLGLGGNGAIRVGPRVHLTGALTTYRHLAGGSSPSVDWSQLRGSLRIDWTLGSEPAVSGRGGGTR